jgi:hypothetical protein
MVDGRRFTRTSVIKNPSQPRHCEFGGSPSFFLGGKRATRIVSNRRPGPHVLWISSELLEAEAVVWSLEDIDASITFERVMAGQYPPRSFESLGHPRTIFRPAPTIDRSPECPRPPAVGALSGATRLLGALAPIIHETA